MSIYPSSDEILEAARAIDNTTQPLLEVRRSMRSILSSFVLFAFSLLIVIVINLNFREINLLGFIPLDIHLSARWLGLIPAITLIEIIRKYHDDLYVFSLHTMTHHDGRLSLTYSVPNIRYADIRAIIVNQDILGRIFDYGNICVDTAAQEKGELIINGVRSPSIVADLIEQLRRNSAKLAADEDREMAEKHSSE